MNCETHFALRACCCTLHAACDGARTHLPRVRAPSHRRSPRCTRPISARRRLRSRNSKLLLSDHPIRPAQPRAAAAAAAATAQLLGFGRGERGETIGRAEKCDRAHAKRTEFGADALMSYEIITR
jgi:hypothetical protein